MWPELMPLADWKETAETVHRWLQIIGKVRLGHAPWVNHSWHVALYPTARGLTTSLMFDGERGFEIALDFTDHRVSIATTDGEGEGFPLEPMAVADFYGRLFAALEKLGIPARIRTMPVEIPDPVERLDRDRQHASYDRDAIHRFWLAVVQAKRVFEIHRARFIGKVSPVHLFWGAFDLAVTRFSGRPAPVHPGGAPHCADWVMQEAYSHEVASAGFWPGVGLGEAAFYAYAYPEPSGFRQHPVEPKAAYYHDELRELILPYEAVRTAADPDAALLSFLESSYRAAADLGGWDRAALEREPA